MLYAKEKVMVRSLIVCVIVLFVSCAAVNVNLTAKSRKPIERSKVERFDALPSKYVDMGTVTVELMSNYGGAEANGKIRGEAAKVGANGFYIEQKEKLPGFSGGASPTARKYRVVGRIFFVE